MFKTVSDLMLHNQLRFEKGRIFIFGRPSSVIPSDSMVNIQKLLEKYHLDGILYVGTKRSGYLWFDEMNKAYKLKASDVFLWGPEIVSLSGWGEVVLKERDDEKKHLTFELRDSVVVELYGKSEKAVDTLFRGVLCGAMERVYSTKLDCVETLCRAKGDPMCQFVLKPSEEFAVDDRLAKEQIFDAKKLIEK